MNKIFQIAKYEFKSAITNKWFVFMGIGFPIIIGIVFLVYTSIKDNNQTDDVVDKNKIVLEGFVDQADIINFIPEQLSGDILQEYSDEDSAKKALEKKEIESYYLIPEDYVKTGELVTVRSDYNLLSPNEQASIMGWVIKQNLSGNPELAGQIQVPTIITETNLVLVDKGSENTYEDCTKPGYQCKSNEFIQYIPFIIVVIFYMLLVTGGGLIIRGVGKEKENRIIEIIMTSATPKQILAGKTSGLGLFALLQFIAWVGILYAILNFGGQRINLPSDFSMPVDVVTWGLIYFIFGYALYALLMAGAGALISKVKEIQAATFSVILPLVIGYIIMLSYGQEYPHAPLSVILSLFPFTSPMAMMHRLSVGDVPLWQPIVGLILLIVTVYLINNLMAKLFQAQNLLSGQPFSAKRFFKAMFGK